MDISVSLPEDVALLEEPYGVCLAVGEVGGGDGLLTGVFDVHALAEGEVSTWHIQDA